MATATIRPLRDQLENSAAGRLLSASISPNIQYHVWRALKKETDRERVTIGLLGLCIGHQHDGSARASAESGTSGCVTRSSDGMKC
jgi:hypothetical protein